MNLIIVESPTKAKTLSKFLGDGFQVKATFGHIRDLPAKKIGINIEHDYEPQYVSTAKQKEKIEEINSAGETAEKIYLATDPDREGEAIAWHVNQVLSAKGVVLRAEFHEITQNAIKEALENPRQVDMKLVDAQQGRRILDRLVGYKLSPLLWKKIRKGLSAGRVQSVAVRLIVEREREIEAFKPEEYWILQVKLQKIVNSSINQLTVKLVELNSQKVEVKNKDQANQIENDLRQADYRVESVERKDFRRTPPAPFTTSTLQQTAANKMGWSAKRTMQIAQSLYEEGYITYHRTDSTNLAIEATRAAADFIGSSYGKEYVLDMPRVYKTKSKTAQEAHEAIRPTEISTKYEELSTKVNKDQARLYDLIWKRFVACQMAETRGVTVIVTVTGKTENDNYGLEARGETISFEGWQRLYQIVKSKEQIENDEEIQNIQITLPELEEGEKLGFVELTSEQKFTMPPARFNDASLIKTLEELGIGRPSTYAPIITTIQDRLYVEKYDKRFKPTSLGLAVNDFLVGNFAPIMDYGFTAKMEEELDEIADGERKWQRVVGDFYQPFAVELEKVSQTAARVQVQVEETGNECPNCHQGREIIRMGRFGKFLACSRYPECTYKANYKETIGVKCPKCGGEVIVRKTKSRKNFFGCSNYPKCDFASWTKPKAESEVKT